MTKHFLLILISIFLVAPSVTNAEDKTPGILTTSFIHVENTLNAASTINDQTCKLLERTTGIPASLTRPIGEYSLLPARVVLELPGSTYDWFTCPDKVLAEILPVGWSTTIADLALHFYRIFSEFLNAIIAWCLKVILSIFLYILGQGSFITNPLVQGAWPFIQGFANLGFIIALLYIAFATTLRIESVSTSVQRLLPKLLIAALLVNFSLVIGGLLIDASRVIMAVEMNLAGYNGQTDTQEFARLLTDATKIVDIKLLAITTISANTSFGAEILALTQSFVYSLILMIAFAVISINLFVRYVALLILLIISPFAYLAFALPKTANYASQWWGMFIKWVLYGPIVLFFLVIIIKIQNIAPQLPVDPNAATKDTWIPFFNALVHFVMVISLFFVANSLGKKVAGIGSDMAMGFANKTGAWARKNPKKAIGIGVGLATGGAAGVGYGLLAAGGAGLAQGTGRNLRDYGTGVQSNFMKKTRAGELFGKGTTAAPKYGRGSLSTLAKLAAGPERNEKGDLKPGEDSFLSPSADRTFQRQDVKAALIEAKRLSALPSTLTQAQREHEYATSAGLSSTELLKKRVATALSKKEKNDIAQYGTAQMKKSLVSHKEAVRGMNEETKNRLMSDADPEIRKAIQAKLTSLENEK